MKTKAILLAGLTLSLLSACSIRANDSVEALLPESSSTARAEIIEVVSTALGGKKVPIAQNVFQESSKLLLSAAPVTSPNGVIVHNKTTQQALVFQLRKQGKNCFLKRIDTEQEWPLETQQCVVKQ